MNFAKAGQHVIHTLYNSAVQNVQGLADAWYFVKVCIAINLWVLKRGQFGNSFIPLLPNELLKVLHFWVDIYFLCLTQGKFDERNFQKWNSTRWMEINRNASGTE